MGDKTKIQWSDATWNVLRGCSRVSAGCTACYAERDAGRMSSGAYKGLIKKVGGEWRWTGAVRFVPEQLDAPLRWKKPRRIFVNSMSDLFHEKVGTAWMTAIFGVMACARRHTFQVLTKRPEQMQKWVSSWGEGEAAYMALLREFANSPIRHQMRLPGNVAACLLPERIAWPLPNVCLGVSVEDQATADARIQVLLQTPAAVRFVSYEPALGPVDFRRYLGVYSHEGPPCGLKGEDYHALAEGHRERLCGTLLDWLIVGGESGPGSRPFDLAWARSAIAQCRAAGVPVFVKQLGARPFWRGAMPIGPPGAIAAEAIVGGLRGWILPLRDRKGGDMAEFPEDLRVREFPQG